MTTLKRLGISVVSVCIIISLLCGCSSNTGSWAEALNEDNSRWNPIGTFEKEFESQKNVAIEDMTTYDYYAIDRSYGMGRFRNFTVEVQTSGAFTPVTLQEFNSVYKVERIKKIDADHIWVVYRVSDDGKPDALMYIMFKRQVSLLSTKDGVKFPGYYERWDKIGYYFLVGKRLSSDDFADVSVDTDVESIVQIDPSILYDSIHAVTDGEKVTFKSYRILTDGLMVIEFEAEDQTMGKEPITAYSTKQVTFYPYEEGIYSAEIELTESLSFIEYIE